MALNEDLINDSRAAQFAVATGYPNPIYGFDPNAIDKYQPIIDIIAAKIGHQPDALTLAAYDALWVMARSYSDSEISGNFDIFKSSFVKNAESYFGATGWTVLNAAGDRKYGNYDFWAVTETDETYSWEMVATYLFDPAGTGDLVRY